MYHETRWAQSLSALAESQRKGNALFLRQTEHQKPSSIVKYHEKQIANKFESC
jgi:hypothetical protein